MSQAAQLYLVKAKVIGTQPPRSLMAENFLRDLSQFNQVMRDLRRRGVVIQAQDFSDNVLVIDEEQANLLSQAFSAEIRRHYIKVICEGRMARNSVTIRGVEVVWFTAVKEQDQ